MPRHTREGLCLYRITIVNSCGKNHLYSSWLGPLPELGAYSIEWRMGADTSDLSLFLIVDHGDQLRKTFVALTLLPKS